MLHSLTKDEMWNLVEKTTVIHRGMTCCKFVTRGRVKYKRDGKPRQKKESKSHKGHRTLRSYMLKH